MLENHVFHHISAYIHPIIICDTSISMYFDLKNPIMTLNLCPDMNLTLWGMLIIYLLSKNHLSDHILTYNYSRMICDTLMTMYIYPLNSDIKKNEKFEFFHHFLKKALCGYQQWSTGSAGTRFQPQRAYSRGKPYRNVALSG